MITPRKTRIPYLDFLKFFAIASVLLGHSVEQTTGNDFWDNPIWSFIYTYHMPLFMLLCGYFFGSSLNLSFGELVKKKVCPTGHPLPFRFRHYVCVCHAHRIQSLSRADGLQLVRVLQCGMVPEVRLLLLPYRIHRPQSLRSFWAAAWFPLSSSPSCPSAM